MEYTAPYPYFQEKQMTLYPVDHDSIAGWILYLQAAVVTQTAVVRRMGVCGGAN